MWSKGKKEGEREGAHRGVGNEGKHNPWSIEHGSPFDTFGYFPQPVHIVTRSLKILRRLGNAFVENNRAFSMYAPQCLAVVQCVDDDATMRRSTATQTNNFCDSCRNSSTRLYLDDDVDIIARQWVRNQRPNSVSELIEHL